VPDPVAPALSAAGIVKTPGIDDVIERVEEAADFAAYRKKFFEGEQQSPEAQAWQRRLLGQIAEQCNKLLAGRVTLTGCHPELMGFGARIYGHDSDGRRYEVDFRYDDEDRMANVRMDDDVRVRASIDIIVTGVLEQRAVYLHRMTGSTGTA
jgi:hypothetical protein